MKTSYFEKSNSIVTMEKLLPSGFYLVELIGKNRDKVRCDTYKEACFFFRAFCKIAKNN